MNALMSLMPGGAVGDDDGGEDTLTAAMRLMSVSAGAVLPPDGVLGGSSSAGGLSFIHGGAGVFPAAGDDDGGDAGPPLESVCDGPFVPSFSMPQLPGSSTHAVVPPVAVAPDDDLPLCGPELPPSTPSDAASAAAGAGAARASTLTVACLQCPVMDFHDIAPYLARALDALRSEGQRADVIVFPSDICGSRKCHSLRRAR